MEQQNYTTRRVAVLAGILLAAALIVAGVSAALADAGRPEIMAAGVRATPPGPIHSMNEATQAFQAYIERTGNKDLVLDEVMEFERNYYAIVKEKSTGTGAFELLADKQTGAVFPEYGPNMMWNTKYGHMAGAGMMGPNGIYTGTNGMMNGYTGTMMNGGMMGRGGMMNGGQGGMMGPNGMMGATGSTSGTCITTVAPNTPVKYSTADAQKIAQTWLDANQPGSTTEQPDQFYGYYTVHILDANHKVTGMLSVNAYTGAVWYHTWHGAFIQMQEVNAQ